MIAKSKKKGEVTFVCNHQPQAGQVFLAGDFNEWDPQDKRMRKYKDGTFRARLQLEPGRYEYKFVVDGNWMVDPDAEGQVRNGAGTVNSLISIG